MNTFPTKEKKELILHLIFLFIVSLYYLIPYFLVGEFITDKFEILEKEIVSDHVIGKFLGGNLDSVNIFLAGEIKWYFLWGILKPFSLLFVFFETEAAFWIRDFVVKIIAYISFFKLSKRLNCSVFNSILIACLFACSLTQKNTFLGLGAAAFPYLIYIVLKNKDLNIKNFFLIIFIGLNTDLIRHSFVVPMLLVLSWVLLPKFQKYNFKLFFKIAIILFASTLLANSNLIYTQLFSETMHRATWIHEPTNIISNLKIFMVNYFSLPTSADTYWFNRLAFTIFFVPLFIVSLFSKNKISYILLLIIFLICFFVFITRLEFVTTFRNNTGGIIKTLQLDTIALLVIPIIYVLIFINYTKLKIKDKTKYFVYPLIFLSIFTFQFRLSAVPLGKYFLSYDTLATEKQNQLKRLFYDKKFMSLFKEMRKINDNKKSTLAISFDNYTFKGYYNYENYKYIKSIVKESRTLSIGLNPMVAVMNNIKVIDGYHNLYPLRYKLKFRKVIQEQLDHYEEIKNYFDNYGNRVETFVSNPKIIKINFNEAKKLGADYIISKYLISNKSLSLICEKCNGSEELFVFKIE